MSDDLTELEGHSAAYFGAYRDLWWNVDDLALLASRWQVEGVASVVDVGCGVGHWGRALLRVLPETAVVTGVDRERRWVDAARERARLAHLEPRLSYGWGDANDLPFGAASFDMVTCQTLLIHLAEPSRALNDMLRP